MQEGTGPNKKFCIFTKAKSYFAITFQYLWKFLQTTRAAIVNNPLTNYLSWDLIMLTQQKRKIYMTNKFLNINFEIETL